MVVREMAIAFMVGLLLVGVACGDDGKNDIAADVDLTGIAQVDAVLSAVEAEDSAQIRKLLQFSRIACTTEPGDGGPPKRVSGESDGTAVEVFLVWGCSVDWRRESTVASALSDLAANSPKRYAVFVPPADYLLKQNDYIIVFEGPDPRTGGSTKRGVAVAVKGGKIAALWFACGAGDGGEVLVPKGLSSFVLPPR